MTVTHFCAPNDLKMPVKQDSKKVVGVNVVLSAKLARSWSWPIRSTATPRGHPCQVIAAVNHRVCLEVHSPRRSRKESDLLPAWVDVLFHTPGCRSNRRCVNKQPGVQQVSLAERHSEHAGGHGILRKCSSHRVLPRPQKKNSARHVPNLLRG